MRFVFILSAAKELRTEVENLAARLHYMEEAKEDVRADIAVMKRAAEKADTEVTKAEMEKKKQVWSDDSLSYSANINAAVEILGLWGQ